MDDFMEQVRRAAGEQVETRLLARSERVRARMIKILKKVRFRVEEGSWSGDRVTYHIIAVSRSKQLKAWFAAEFRKKKK